MAEAVRWLATFAFVMAASVVAAQDVDKPTHFRVTRTTATSLEVFWDMPTNGDFVEFGEFSLRYNTGFRDKYDQAEGGRLSSRARTFVYRDLKPNTKYYLKIQALMRGQRKSATTEAKTLPEWKPTAPSSQAKRCEEYTGSVCSQYLRGRLVYVENTTDQAAMESIAKQALGALNRDCHHAAEAVVCQMVLKPCHVEEWLDSRFFNAVPRSVCGEDCNRVKTACAPAVWNEVENTLEQHKAVVVNATCGDLPRANGGDFPECVSFGALEANDNGNAASCYYGKGEGYQGTIHITESERTCSSWVMGNDSHGVTQRFGISLQQAKDMKNYCRNPQGRGSRPWCYVGGSNRWEYCSKTLPQCGQEVLCEKPETDGRICLTLQGYRGFDIYMDVAGGKTQKTVNDQVDSVLQKLHLFVDTDGAAQHCATRAARIMCYMSLPVCVQDAKGAIHKRHVCRENCESYRKDCPLMAPELDKYFTESVHSVLDLTFLRWPINCSSLPAKNGGDFVECVDESVDGKTDGNIMETVLPVNASEQCYWEQTGNMINNGISYRGVRAKTKSGFICQPWNSSYPYDNPFVHTIDLYPDELTENYCRNPDRRSNEPWCYTKNPKVRWERCDIMKCDPAPPSGSDESGENFTIDGSNVENSVMTDSSTTVLAIVGGIAGAFLITVCIVSVLYVVHRRKVITARSNSLPISLMALNRGRTNSSAIEHNPYYLTQESLSCREVDPDRIVFVAELGEGNFGKVFKGLVQGFNDSEEATTVAIKTLKVDSNDHMRKEFFHEAQLMSNFNHKNIVRLLGVCVENSAMLCMLFEYMELGDLNNYLREHNRRISNSDPAANTKRGYYYSTTTATAEMLESCSSESVGDKPLDNDRLVHVAVQIAAGMYYLAHRRYVHRDLATRNCLVSNGLMVKIADFGMSQDIYSTDYYRVGGAALLPVRWMPPEAIIYGKFTVESDVWSFGVVMWEIFSYAMQPYFGFSNEEVVDTVRRGRLLSCPDNCPSQIYSLMKECWNMEPEERPSFKKLYRRLSEWGKTDTGRHYTTLTSSVTTFEEEESQHGSDEGHDDVFERGEGLHVELPQPQLQSERASSLNEEEQNHKRPNGHVTSETNSNITNGTIVNGHMANGDTEKRRVSTEL